MTNNINFRHAAIAAGVAVIWGALSPSSFLGTVATVAISAIAALSMEATGQIWDETQHDVRAQAHQVEQITYYGHETEQASLKSALERLKQHAKPYKWLLKSLKLQDDEKLLAWFIQEFKRGCCFGHTSNFIQHLKDGKTSQTPEDVFYNQMLHVLHKNLECRIANIDSETPKYKRERESLSKVEFLSLFNKSKKVDPSLPLEAYQTFLDTHIESPEMGLMGYVIVPYHYLGFQYSPMGYFLYDSISPKWGGLQRYLDKQTFVEGLRTQVLRDIAEIKRIRPVNDERIVIGVAPLKINGIPDQGSQG